MNEQKERFLPKIIKICIDGISERWEFEKSYTVDDEMLIKYKLAKRTTYKTDV